MIQLKGQLLREEVARRAAVSEPKPGSLAHAAELAARNAKSDSNNSTALIDPAHNGAGTSRSVSRLDSSRRIETGDALLAAQMAGGVSGFEDASEIAVFIDREKDDDAAAAQDMSMSAVTVAVGAAKGNVSALAPASTGSKFK